MRSKRSRQAYFLICRKIICIIKIVQTYFMEISNSLHINVLSKKFVSISEMSIIYEPVHANRYNMACVKSAAAHPCILI